MPPRRLKCETHTAVQQERHGMHCKNDKACRVHTTTISLRRVCIILHYRTHTRQVVCPSQASSRIVKYEKSSQSQGKKYVSHPIIQSSNHPIIHVIKHQTVSTAPRILFRVQVFKWCLSASSVLYKKYRSMFASYTNSKTHGLFKILSEPL